MEEQALAESMEIGRRSRVAVESSGVSVHGMRSEVSAVAVECSRWLGGRALVDGARGMLLVCVQAVVAVGSAHGSGLTGWLLDGGCRLAKGSLVQVATGARTRRSAAATRSFAGNSW